MTLTLNNENFNAFWTKAMQLSGQIGGITRNGLNAYAGRMDETTPEDVRRLVTLLQNPTEFTRRDRDQNGVISGTELLSRLSNGAEPIQVLVGKSFDITEDNFNKWVSEVGGTDNFITVAELQQRVDLRVSQGRAGALAARVKKEFNNLDTNVDGKLSRDELRGSFFKIDTPTPVQNGPITPAQAAKTTPPAAPVAPAGSGPRFVNGQIFFSDATIARVRQIRNAINAFPPSAFGATDPKFLSDRPQVISLLKEEKDLVRNEIFTALGTQDPARIFDALRDGVPANLPAFNVAPSKAGLESLVGNFIGQLINPAVTSQTPLRGKAFDIVS